MEVAVESSHWLDAVLSRGEAFIIPVIGTVSSKAKVFIICMVGTPSGPGVLATCILGGACQTCYLGTVRGGEAAGRSAGIVQ